MRSQYGIPAWRKPQRTSTGRPAGFAATWKTFARPCSRVSANWEGEAQTQYNTMQHQWNQKADHVQNILGDIANKVRRASGDYHATDKRAAGNF